MKLPRTPSWAKLLCACFACLLLGACASLSLSALQLFSLYGTSSTDGGVAGSSVAEDYCKDAWDLFVLSQHKKSLTYLGNQRRDALTEQLDLDNTNFRYRILDMNGKVLGGNIKKDLSGAVERTYDALYPAYADSAYITVEEQDLPAETVDGNWSAADVSIWDDVAVASTVSTTDSSLHYTYITYNRDYIDLPPKYITTKTATPLKNRVLEWGIASPMTIRDDLLQWEQDASQNQGRMLPTVSIAIVTGALGLFCLCYLLAATGHKLGTDAITPTGCHRCPWDLMLALTAVVTYFYVVVIWDALQRMENTLVNATGSDTILPNTLLLQLGVLAAVGIALWMPLLTTLAAQVKTRQWWKRTILCRLGRRLWQLFRLIPLHFKAFSLCTAYLLCYAFLCFLGGRNHVTLPLIFAFVLAALALVALLWWLWGWSILRKGSQALANGDLNYTTDTTGLPWDLQKHGADLNAISDGMQKAVEERMRSDRFRTELITNVSHDLKTPLTSIINYVDLLKKLNLEDPTAQQYIDVLDRKSQRLKTLTEDLVEASKASAGVLAVDRQRLETTQLVRQALAEYEDKLRAAQLRVIQRYPKEGAWIMADGRHLWRILDNLLSNCAKYAMPGTRLYVDVIRRDGNVEISLKNISADPLNIPSDDLLRRFVRGDDSRSTPGSGLGLSIAQSLAHLQGAEFSIDIDGDLFKALVRFPESAEEN
mgnify:CR=1 FL=1